jgi:hypothetical protein
MVLHRGEFIEEYDVETDKPIYIRVAGEFQSVAGDFDLIAIAFVFLQIMIRCLVISMKYGTISEHLFKHKRTVLYDLALLNN